MAGDLYFDAARAIAASEDLITAGTEFDISADPIMLAIVAASRQPPWGSDSIGASFQQNYLPQQNDFLAAVQQVAKYIEDLGTVALKSTYANEHADEQASAQMRTVARKL